MNKNWEISKLCINLEKEKEEYRIRLYGALWLLVFQEVISESRARELAGMTATEFQNELKEIQSPCVSICRLREGVCEGCGRTIDEIMDWPNMTNRQKLEVLQRIGDSNE